MKKKFAAFDIDGTVARTSLFLQIVDELIEQKRLPKGFHYDLEQKLEAYNKRLSPNAFVDYTSYAVEILMKNIRNVSVAHYRAAVDRVIKRSYDRVYVFTRDLIQELREEGYFLIAISGSEMYAVKQFAKHHGFDVAIGEQYHTANGFFTGEIEPVVHRKELFLEQLIKVHDLDYEHSIAVGDTIGDYSMLAYVHKPLAFNPEQRLYEKAREHGWPIVVERKNVIYELEPFEKSYRLR